MSVAATTSTSPTPLTEWQRRSLAILIVVMTIDLLSFTCILPLFPSIFDFYSAKREEDWLYVRFEELSAELQRRIGIPVSPRHNNVFFAGVLGAVFSFLQYLSSPLFGALSDVYGRRPIFLLSIFGSFCSYYLWSIATNFTIFTASRIIGGLSKASVSIAIAVVTDLCPTVHRGKGMAFVGMAFSFAFMTGPLFGAYFANRARESNSQMSALPAQFAMGLTVVELLLVLWALPETHTASKRSAGLRSTKFLDYVSPRALFRFNVLGNKQSPKIRQLGSIYFIYLLLYSGFEFTLSFLTHLRFGYTSVDQGKMYFITGTAMILIQGGLVRRIKPDKQRNGALLGLAAIMPSFLLMGFAFSSVLFYSSLLLYAVASSLVVPCLTTMVANECGDAEKGACLGVFRSLGALSRALGPLVGSGLFWLLGPTYAYGIGGILLAVPFVLMNRLAAKPKSA